MSLPAIRSYPSPAFPACADLLREAAERRVAYATGAERAAG